MNDDLSLVVMSKQNKHLGVMSAKGVGDVCMKQLDVGIALCCFLQKC